MPIKIEVNGIHTELRPKSTLLTTINAMINDANRNLAQGQTKNKAKRRAEESTISFFGSIKHYLEGGAEV
ncbi:hypothetical protein [Mucilaginibacter glaciei]|uniref:Uncharacterized protein n=1 Tax=Mucilaginibacter glaciei TaxID=2772109 RepID=A0A926S727_9SPHI|nr:hypothetical protein [Mucilaginibacter glaciei]MBD1394286.1 hypothetical protein [Mucilaginibacter glaciei]